MGKSLGAYVSDKFLFSFPGDPKGTAKRGDGGEQERWRTGIGTQSFGQHKLKRSLTYLLYDARLHISYTVVIQSALHKRK